MYYEGRPAVHRVKRDHNRIAWTIADTPVLLRATPYDLIEDELKPAQPVGFSDWPAGMTRASASDAALLAAVVANGGAARQKRLLSSAGSAEMLAMRMPRAFRIG